MAAYKRALMCAPHYYDIPAVENPHMAGGKNIDKELALREWTDLVNILQHFGVVVHFMLPAAERWDMVFAANGGWAHGGCALLSNFRLPIRRPEQKHFQDALGRMGFSRKYGMLRKLPDDIVWEGQGDTLTGSQGVHFMGWGIRSDHEALPYLEDFLSDGEWFIDLRLTNPNFYHLDTCLLPIPSRDALVFYRKAFDLDSLEKLGALGTDGIELSMFLAYCFVANSIVLDGTVLLNVPFAPTDECRELSARGVLLTDDKRDPRFGHLVNLDSGEWLKDKELFRKTNAVSQTPFHLEGLGCPAGYPWFVRELWKRKLNVVPVYTSQFMPSGAGARCCVMLVD